MHRDHQRWYSHRLNRDMGVAIYGNYGAPILAFPTSCGDESEMEGQGMIRTLAPYIDQGRIRIFCINGVQSDSFANKGAHPFHRSWMQAQADDYVASEVFPFIDSQCQTPGIGSPRSAHRWSLSRGQHSLKHPDPREARYALSAYTTCGTQWTECMTKLLLDNPVDYIANRMTLVSPSYATYDIRLMTAAVRGRTAGRPTEC